MLTLTYRQLSVLLQLLFWVGYFLFILFTFAYFFTFEIALIRSLLTLLINALLVYAHFYWLMPRFFEQRRFGVYICWLVLLVAAASLLRAGGDYALAQSYRQQTASTVGVMQQSLRDEEALSRFLAELYLSSPNERAFARKINQLFFVREIDRFLLSPMHIGSIVLTSLLVLLITLPLRLMENWHRQRALQQELQSRQLETELKFLKMQVNPHFLFNTLNNLYTLAFTQSDKAAPMIMKLSEMMRYMIYDASAPRVKLQQEVQYLHNYIALQQLKTARPQRIEFEVVGDTSVPVPPMLFVSLFENAFKHGMLEDVEKGWMKARLEVKEGRMLFRIANNFRPHTAKDQQGGIGLENIRQRLNLLYPRAHQFRVQAVEGVFSVEIELFISPNPSGHE
ncbi:MAG: hypothetical protein D6730_08980 [Bacteroidetes bacterium]|nr:MAG: hypothetical protein D6730_08980 [Bacteroidota bacterium]